MGCSQTDIDYFVCGKDKSNADIYNLLMATHQAIKTAGSFGESKIKVWDGALYNEISLQVLSGKTTVIMDFDHPKYQYRETIEHALSKRERSLPLSFINNRGATSDWRVILILCSP